MTVEQSKLATSSERRVQDKREGSAVQRGEVCEYRVPNKVIKRGRDKVESKKNYAEVSAAEESNAKDQSQK